MLRSGRLSLGDRIVLSFGMLFALMMIMAVVSYNRLHAIDQETLSLERDSVSGLYLSTSLRAIMRNSHATLERTLFADAGSELADRDLEHATQFVHDLDKHSADYENTVYHDDDRQCFHAYRAVVDKHLPVFNEATQLVRTSKPVTQAIARRAVPVWEGAAALADKLVTDNQAVADESVRQIRASIQSTEITLAMTPGMTLLVTLVLDYALFKAITVPTAQMVDVHNNMRTGSLTGRLDLRHNDKFGTLEEGFSHMAGELASLASQAQKSFLQAMTSAAEIAATSKEQQITVAKTAATTTEIGTTSRGTFATFHDLLHMMNEVLSVTE